MRRRWNQNSLLHSEWGSPANEVVNGRPATNIQARFLDEGLDFYRPGIPMVSSLSEHVLAEHQSLKISWMLRRTYSLSLPVRPWCHERAELATLQMLRRAYVNVR